ncbi:MAG TPA: heparinase II/III family protein [bacterium]|nr:heparinase II/III family protein [bacterium]HOL49869.1 heparinase II/III family protein [bacterium]HPO51508.1 heparinase II/III family protein [bacterium]
MKSSDFIIPEKEVILKKGELRKQLKNKLNKEARKIIDTDIPVVTYSMFKLFHLTGDRVTYEKPFREKRRNLVILAMAYYLTGNKKYLMKLQDYIWETCNEPSWSLPAHLPETLNYEKRYIDLVVSTTAATLAEILALTGDHLDENIKKRIMYELEKRVFIPFYQHPGDYGWFERYDSNWCAVCCGAIGTAVILAGRNQVYFEKIVNNVAQAISRYFDNFDTQGAWVEGISYWNYGLTHAVRFADTLYRATDGKLNLFNHLKIQLTGLFPVHCFLPPDGFVNFGDCHRHVALTRETMLLLAIYTKAGKYISWLARHVTMSDLQEIRSLRDIKIPAGSVPDETFVHYPDIGWVITRKNWKDKNGPVFAIKAGNNNEPHNQIDVGQFIFHVFGEDYLCDHGAGKYTKDYFSAKRYQNPFCSAEGHSVIFIDGKGQGIGPEFCGKILKAQHSKDVDEVVVNLIGAYPVGLASNITRTATFSKKQKYGLLLIDDFIETSEERTIESRLQYNGQLKKLDRSHFILKGKNGKVAINILKPEKFSVSIGKFGNLEEIAGEKTPIQFLKITTKSRKTRFLIEFQPVL